MFDPRLERDSERADMRRLTNHRFDDSVTLDALIEVVHTLSLGSPEEIRILSGLVRAMRGYPCPVHDVHGEHLNYAVAHVEQAQAGHATHASAAWHIALALDALTREGT